MITDNPQAEQLRRTHNIGEAQARRLGRLTDRVVYVAQRSGEFSEIPFGETLWKLRGLRLDVRRQAYIDATEAADIVIQSFRTGKYLADSADPVTTEMTLRVISRSGEIVGEPVREGARVPETSYFYVDVQPPYEELMGLPPDEDATE